ncbi:MAG: hypothetical protein ACRDA4_10045 [Filifactoraceae bacterium]
MSRFKAGSCTDINQISTLEIKSDFVEEAYIQALKPATETYIKLISIAFFEVNT